MKIALKILIKKNVNLSLNFFFLIFQYEQFIRNPLEVFKSKPKQLKNV